MADEQLRASRKTCTEGTEKPLPTRGSSWPRGPPVLRNGWFALSQGQKRLPPLCSPSLLGASLGPVSPRQRERKGKVDKERSEQQDTDGPAHPFPSPPGGEGEGGGVNAFLPPRPGSGATPRLQSRSSS